MKVKEVEIVKEVMAGEVSLVAMFFKMNMAPFKGFCHLKYDSLG